LMLEWIEHMVGQVREGVCGGDVYIHTYTHTCIHTYIHTHTHTYIHMSIW